MEEPITAIAYMRICSRQQVKEIHSRNNFAAQKQRIAEYAERNNIKIVEWFEEVSDEPVGRKTNVLDEAYTYAMKNLSVKSLLVSSPDRISRRFPEYCYWETLFERAYIEIKSAVGLADNSPQGRFMAAMHVLSADLAKQERVKAGLRRREAAKV